MPLTTADRLEIIELFARYARATDGVDAVARADVFTDDGVFDASSGTPLRGRAELLNAHRPDNAADLRHWVNNTLIEGDGDTARATTYLAVFDTGESTARPPGIWVTGVYYDTLRKVDSRWKFAYRNFVRDDLRGERTVGHLL